MTVKQGSVAILGAGPYGLSLAAHLRARGIPARVFGKTMEFWERMPPGMHLKSIWSASSIADPARRYDLDSYVDEMGSSRPDPIPLPMFVAYGMWFQRHAAPDVDPTYVRTVARDGDGFRLELEDGRVEGAAKVIVAAGIQSFAHLPAFARHLPPHLASHSQDYTDFSRFAGRSVAVLGRGQSAVQTAAFLHEAGASTELIARGPVIWIDRKLYRLTGPARHVFYPKSDVGPPGLNWLIHFPQAFRTLPVETRRRVEQRATRPAGAPWLRHRVEHLVRETSGVEVTGARPHGDTLEIALSDGSTRAVDHLFLATGYRPSLDRFSFLDADLRAAITDVDGMPMLTRSFESSVSGMYFAGAIASYSFGPLCRFVTGAATSARWISAHIARTLPAPSIPVTVPLREEVAAPVAAREG